MKARPFNHTANGNSAKLSKPALPTRDEREFPSAMSRRGFLATTAAAGATLLTAGWESISQATAPQATAVAIAPRIEEATIPQLQGYMALGHLTSRQLTLAYLYQIDRLNPLLNAVIETDPKAVEMAIYLDNERRQGRLRGPLHGIPILVKDNIAVDGAMQTTAGSLALVGSRVGSAAPVVARLRAAGAVILGKTNLSEWANFRGTAPCPSSWSCLDGWSARGGFTHNPYNLAWDSSGSSSGSAVAVATNMCAAAVGTETDGSILSPSANNLIVGLKPTVGLVSQEGIIPISHSQDTAGPMGRTVTDVAVLLGALQSPFGAVAGMNLPTDYTQFLSRGALRGARIGVDRKFFTANYGGETPFGLVAQHAITVMRSLGAQIIDPVNSADPAAFNNAEVTVLLCEFKTQIAEYLDGLGRTRMRTLANLIAFNDTHCQQEMKYFGQELFEASEATGGLADSHYVAARQSCIQLSRTQGIDAALARHSLDAILTPTWCWGTSPAAVAGYPSISVPVALTAAGRPAGIWMFGGFLQEPKLLALAYDLEQEIKPRVQPSFPGRPPVWSDAGICAGLPKSQAMAPLPQYEPSHPAW